MKNVLFWLPALMLMLASCSEDVPASITCTTTNLTFDSSGGTQTLSFEANKDWSITAASGLTWCSLSPATGTPEITSVQVTAAPNETYDERNVTLTIVCEDVSHTVTVVQKQKDALLLTSDKVEVDVKGGTVELEVKANIDYRMEISEDAKGWITEATTRGLSSYKHTLNIAANESYDKREGQIYFISGEKKDTLTVLQAQVDALIISEKTFRVPGEGGTVDVKLAANVDFEVVIPEDVTWVTRATTRGLVDHTVKLEVAENLDCVLRTVEIVFMNKESGLSEVVTLTQEEYILEVSLTTAGTLTALLGDKMSKIRKMILTGSLNGSDIQVLHDMATKYNLVELDMSGASIISEGTYRVGNNEYAAVEKTINDYMFYCSKLKSIVLPDDITWIGEWAFSGCVSLSNFVIPEGVTLIDDWAFSNCDSLQEIVIPESVTEIGSFLFSHCNTLSKVVFLGGITDIGYECFSSCASLTDVIIPNSVTTIQWGAFFYCTSLTNIILPESITYISGWVFYYCI